MRITVSRRAAAHVCSWFALAGVVLSLPFWGMGGLVTFACVTVWCLLWMVGGTLHVASYRLYMGKHHLSVRHGILLQFTRRLPLRYITGCHIIASPVQRRTGTCILVLLGSGSVTVIPGAPAAAATSLAAKLTGAAGGTA